MMPSYSGNLVLLQLQDTAKQWVNIGGMRTTRFVLNNQLVDASHKESGTWRHTLAGAGIASISISGNGIFTDSEAEARLRTIAFANQTVTYRLCFGNGDHLCGLFAITSYERVGNLHEEESYSITLESAGAVSYETSVEQS